MPNIHCKDLEICYLCQKIWFPSLIAWSPTAWDDVNKTQTVSCVLRQYTILWNKIRTLVFACREETRDLVAQIHYYPRRRDVAVWGERCCQCEVGANLANAVVADYTFLFRVNLNRLIPQIQWSAKFDSDKSTCQVRYSRRWIFWLNDINMITICSCLKDLMPLFTQTRSIYIPISLY